MATKKAPLKIGGTTPIIKFESGDTVDPIYGGTGLTATEMTAAAVGDVMVLNATKDGFDLEAPSGGGGGGDSMGSGFTSGGGSGNIPDGTVANIEGEFTFSGPVLLDGGPGSALKWVMLKSTDVFDGVFQLYNTDEGGVGIEYYFDGSGVRSTVLFSSGGFQFSTNDGIDNSYFQMTPYGHTFADGSSTNLGMQYTGDYSTTVMANNRSIPDVGTIKKMSLAGPQQYTTTARDALTPAAGWTIYNTTLNKTQTYDGSTWQSHW